MFTQIYTLRSKLCEKSAIPSVHIDLLLKLNFIYLILQNLIILLYFLAKTKCVLVPYT